MKPIKAPGANRTHNNGMHVVSGSPLYHAGTGFHSHFETWRNDMKLTRMKKVKPPTQEEIDAAMAELLAK